MSLALDGSDDREAEGPLSSRLARLAEAGEALAWPDRVTRAMADLKDVTDRVTGLMERVSGNALSVGDLAAAMGDDVIAGEAVEAPGSADRDA